MPYVSVFVDADDVLEEISTVDLISELKDRGDAPKGLDLSDSTDQESVIHELHVALKLGHQDRVIEIVRRHVNDKLGTAL